MIQYVKFPRTSEETMAIILFKELAKTLLRGYMIYHFELIYSLHKIQENNNLMLKVIISSQLYFVNNRYTVGAQ